MLRRAFTMIELIFVIVVMGIIGKFGVEFLARAYQSFFITTLQNRLQQESETAVTQLAARLQYRIKDSIVMSAAGANTLQWVGSDIEGWRGDWNGTRNVPNWSGFINIETAVNPNVNLLRTPQSDTGLISTTIAALSRNTNFVRNAAIFFTGASDPTDTVWDGAVGDQDGELAHPIMAAAGINQFQPSVDDFSGVDVYEFYKLAWSAYAVQLNGTTLTLFYNYQPWEGDTLAQASSSILMENVNSFTFRTEGDVVNISVCVRGNNVGENISVCKEKNIF